MSVWSNEGRNEKAMSVLHQRRWNSQRETVEINILSSNFSELSQQLLLSVGKLSSRHAAQNRKNTATQSRLVNWIRILLPEFTEITFVMSSRSYLLENSLILEYETTFHLRKNVYCRDDCLIDLANGSNEPTFRNWLKELKVACLFARLCGFWHNSTVDQEMDQGVNEIRGYLCEWENLDPVTSIFRTSGFALGRLQ